MDNSLTHYGILGMRWGIRRSKAQLRRARGPTASPRRVTREQYEAEKQRAIRSGDRATVERWRSRLDNTEYRAAVDRLKLDYDLQNAGKEKMQSGWDKLADVVSKANTTISLVQTGLNAYDIVRKVNNTFNDNFKLREIDGTSDREKAEAKAKQAEKDELTRRQSEARATQAEITTRKMQRDEFDTLYNRWVETKSRASHPASYYLPEGKR